MPGLLHNALGPVTHGQEDIFPDLVLRPRHGTPRVPTVFENCFLNRKMGETRTKGRFDGRPCRFDEEESCNKVHATCARTLKYAAHEDPNWWKLFDELEKPCKPRPDPGPKGGLKPAMPEKPPPGAMLAAAKGGGWGEGAVQSNCNARLIDLPYGMMNAEAAKDEDKSITQILGIRRAARTEPGRSVWGLAVHGKSGTFSFDSGGTHIADYIYSIDQGAGLPHDYYVCDSRTHPSACALIGGNIKRVCAEWYDPRQCHFCEDHGMSITCEIRGWNPKYLEWARVPIYPRDLLGEMYKGEFRDVMARPMWATISIPKWVLRAPVKEMPSYMVMEGDSMKAVKEFWMGPNDTMHAAAAMITDSKMPDPVFPTDFPERPGLGFQRSAGAKKQTPRDQKNRPRMSAREFL